MPAYNGAAPTKASTAQYDYTFSGWSPAVVAVTGNADYVAQYNGVVRSYTVRFVNEDGTELQSDTLAYGEMPEYTGTQPEKAEDAQYTYSFNGWDHEIAAVTGEATYTATYSNTIKQYTIRFLDEDGTSVLESKQVNYGEMPAYTGAEPTKAATAQYEYSFSGWSPALVAVTGDADYVATYSSTLQYYAVHFEDENGTILYSEQFAYGATPVYGGETPTKESTAQYEYSFSGWSPALAPVEGETTYTATFGATVREYEIRFQNDDWTTLQSDTLPYGAMPEYTGPTPTKESSVSVDYTFAGWNVPITTVDGNKVYTATYNSSPREYTIRFVNEDGSELQSEQVAYGELPVYNGSTPEKLEDEHYTYEFAGWDESIVAVSGDKTYTATYDSVIIPLDVNETYDFTAWKFGAGEFCGDDDRSWAMPAAEAHVMKYKVYNQDTFELRLPRIDFSSHPEVSMAFEGTNYHGRVTLGLDANDVTHKDGVEENRDIVGTLMFVLDDGKLYEQLVFGSVVINNVITDGDIIWGRKSVSIYVGALWDRFFNIYDITFGREHFVGQTFDLTDNKAGAYEKKGADDVTWVMGSNRTVGDDTYTSNADHLMYAIYDQATFECGLPKVNFIFNKAVTMDLYAPGWNSGAKVGLLENDVNYTSGSGDSHVNGQLAFVYTGGKLLGILDFGTTHKVFDVTDNDVILGNKNPVLWMTAYYNRQVLVSNIQVHPDGEFAMTHDWAVDKLGAAIYKDGSDVTWGFGTYTTSSCLGYRLWDTSTFQFVMPKINYSLTKKATFDFESTVWHQNVLFGFTEEDMTHKVTTGADGDGNINNIAGKLEVVNNGNSLTVTFTLSDVSITQTVTDENIMRGNVSLGLFAKAVYDRTLFLDQIKLAF